MQTVFFILLLLFFLRILLLLVLLLLLVVFSIDLVTIFTASLNPYWKQELVFQINETSRTKGLLFKVCVGGF
jgi:hypothetical protein